MSPARLLFSPAVALILAAGCHDPTRPATGLLYVQVYAAPGAPPPVVTVTGPDGFVKVHSASALDTVAAGTYTFTATNTRTPAGLAYLARPSAETLYVAAGGYAIADSIKYCTSTDWSYLGCPP